MYEFELTLYYDLFFKNIQFLLQKLSTLLIIKEYLIYNCV